MSTCDVVVIGASAGGFSAVKQLLADLPGDLPACLFLTLHLRPDTESNLPTILRRSCLLETVFPRDQEVIRRGYVYIAPPNRHMLIQNQRIRLTNGPRENGSRPAIDPLFRSAAANYGPRVIGIVLSGSLDDGTAGLQAIKERGGLAIIQDPAEAEFESMPRAAMESLAVDYVLPVAEIAQQLVSLTEGNGNAEQESLMQAAENPSIEEPGIASDDATYFSCPDCGGVLVQLREGEFMHYRCEVGHIYSPQTLLSQQNKGIEDTLWAALRSLEEKARLATRLAKHMRTRDYGLSASRFEEQAQNARKHANTLRDILERGVAE